MGALSASAKGKGRGETLFGADASRSDLLLMSVTGDNIPPIANAGSDQTVSEGEVVMLNGSRSTDPDDGIADYRWRQVSGPQVVLSDPLSVQPTFVAPQAGPDGVSLVFALTVTDRGGLRWEHTQFFKKAI
jgi:hypothetical protein